MLEYGLLIKRLLTGEFICRINDPDAYRHLQDESARQAMDNYLRPLNYRIVSNETQTVYYAGFCEMNHDTRSQLMNQLRTLSLLCCLCLSGYNSYRRRKGGRVR